MSSSNILSVMLGYVNFASELVHYEVHPYTSVAYISLTNSALGVSTSDVV